MDFDFFGDVHEVFVVYQSLVSGFSKDLLSPHGHSLAEHPQLAVLQSMMLQLQHLIVGQEVGAAEDGRPGLT